MRYYQQMISKRLQDSGVADVDPRYVESILRAEYGTLDGISSDAMEAEIDAAVVAIRTPPMEIDFEALAATFGL